MAVIDQYGRPMSASTEFTSASAHHRAMALWNPSLSEGDRATREKPRMEARILDAMRNNPFVAGLVRSQVDAMVGPEFRLALQPDHVGLGIDRARRKKWVQSVEKAWHDYAESPECWIDSRREMTFSDMMRMAASQDLMHGEFFAAKEWRGSPLGLRTCFQVVDPMRVKASGQDAENGIERDQYGAPVAYRVQTRKNGAVAKEQRIPKYNRFGWMQMIHVYDPIRPGQSRGLSRLAAALTTIKQLDRYQETELEKAILAASYALYLRSELPNVDQVFEGAGLSAAYKTMLEARNSHYSKRPVTANGATITHLFPGEELGALNIQNPTASYDGFVTAVLRGISRATGSSYALFSGDYSKTSFASGKMERGDEERFIATKRASFVGRAATLMFRIWLDEAVDKGIVEAPVDYWPNRDALTRCTWVATGKTHMDDLKTARARAENLRNGLGTLEQYAREDGQDYEDLFDQRVEEGRMKIEALEEIGVTLSDQDKARILFGELTGSSVEPSEIDDQDEDPDERSGE